MSIRFFAPITIVTAFCTIGPLIPNAHSEPLAVSHTQYSTAHSAHYPTAAYNTLTDELLVVWSGVDGPAGSEVNQLFGQLIDPNPRVEIGEDFVISANEMVGGASVQARVVYNSTDNNFFVVWTSSQNVGSVPNPVYDYEVYGQLIDQGGNLLGANLRISDMGDTDGVAAYRPADFIDVAYNPIDNEYLVVWSGDDDDSGNGAEEIFYQRVDANGANIGVNDARLTHIGALNDPHFANTSDQDKNFNYSAEFPKAVYNTTENEYLVIYNASDNIGKQKGVFAQHLSREGAKVGTLQVVSSNSVLYPPQSNTGLAYNPDRNEYMVIWHGSTGSPDFIQHISVRRLDGQTAAPLELDDLSSVFTSITIFPR
ncbi:MAG: hypothetical protein R3C68_05710 [Myxococcota bacterium]